MASTLIVPVWGSLDNPNANSYVTTTEMAAYMAARENYDVAEWNNLSDTVKDFRLKVATMLVDSLRYRGVRATRQQCLAYPRIFPSDKGLWAEQMTQLNMMYAYEDYATLLEYLKVWKSLKIYIESATAGAAAWEPNDVITITISGSAVGATTAWAAARHVTITTPSGKSNVAAVVTGAWPLETITLTCLADTSMFSCVGTFSGVHQNLSVDTENQYIYFQPPSIPRSIKYATMEIAHQVVGKYLMTLDPLEAGETTPQSITVGKLSVTFGGQTQATGGAQELFNKMSLNAATIINLYLQPYLTQVRAAVL